MALEVGRPSQSPSPSLPVDYGWYMNDDDDDNNNDDNDDDNNNNNNKNNNDNGDYKL